MKSEIKGVIPPLTTPFTEEGLIFEEGLKNLLDFQIEGGSHAVFLCGTYGSGPLMSPDQRKKVVEIANKHIKGRIPIIAHVGTTNTRDSIELSKHAEQNGAKLVAAVPPYYFRHDEDTVFEYYKQLINSIEIPVYIYNNPKTSGFTVTPSFLAKLADIGLKGIKDSRFSFVEFSHMVLELADHKEFTFVIGTESLLLPAMLIGAKACVSGLANAFPELVVSLYNATVEGDYNKAAKLQLKVNEARRALHIPNSTNAACYAMLRERGVEVGYPIRPILQVKEDKLSLMKRKFRQMNLID